MRVGCGLFGSSFGTRRLDWGVGLRGEKEGERLVGGRRRRLSRECGLRAVILRNDFYTIKALS